MTYANYATKINNTKTTIEQILTNISEIDLESSWEGNAAKKQITNLKTILTEKSTQLNNLDDLSSALLLMDEYDSEKKLANEYQTNINNLNTEDPNYQENKDRLVSLKNKAVEKYQSLKKQIEDKLSNITTRYSEQYVDLPATTVESTVNLYQNAQSKLSEIDNHLTIKATAKNGDVIYAANSGTILSIDNYGTKLEKEPTPGRSAQILHVYHNGVRLYDDAYITVKKGETIKLVVNISDNAGEVKMLKRNTPDGLIQENPDGTKTKLWKNYFTSENYPRVNRYKDETHLPTDHYEWTITADKVTKGYVELSQTTFHSTENAPEYKSMYGIHIKVVE